MKPIINVRINLLFQTTVIVTRWDSVNNFDIVVNIFFFFEIFLTSLSIQVQFYKKIEELQKM